VNASAIAIVQRSPVPVLGSYAGYREYLRFDFWFACAYCSISEVEALGIGFQIDHHEPQEVCKVDVHSYSNLMWSCTVCNSQKSDIWPSSKQLEEGFRFVRPDVDNPAEHFKLAAYRLIPITNAGEYTEQVLFLNRQALKRLRRVRERLVSSNRGIAHGLQALRGAKLDRLKPALRARYFDAREGVIEQAGKLLSISEDDIVRVLNHSPYLDPDPEVRGRTRKRREYLLKLNARFPEVVPVDADDE